MKLFYDQATSSLYFIKADALMVVHQWKDGTFDSDEAYEVWEWDKSIAEEVLEQRTIGSIWQEARKALKVEVV